MENQPRKPTPLWAYPAALLLLAVLTFIQNQFFSDTEHSTLSIESSNH